MGISKFFAKKSDFSGQSNNSNEPKRLLFGKKFRQAVARQIHLDIFPRKFEIS